VNALRQIFNRTLNNVAFGISIMVLTGFYIAVGSGMPRVREIFEMNEMQFFNAWPLKVLMLLLVTSLLVVTWTRIPLTLPRAGVWMIHLGICTLIFGMSGYYTFKTEGQIYITRGRTITGYYENGDRSLYVRLSKDGNEYRLPSFSLVDLPRFKTRKAADGKALSNDLKDMPLTFRYFENGRESIRSVAKDMDLPEEIKLDVVAYHPYATIVTSYDPDPAGKLVGVQVDLPDPHSGRASTTTLVASDPEKRHFNFGGVTVEHWHQPMLNIDELIKQASQMHRLDIAVGDYKHSLQVKVGQTYEIGPTGYSFTIEGFNPSFPMSGTGEMVKVLTLMVKNTTPGKEAQYRRMVIDGKPEIQTDFKLNEPGAGPMGKRQKEPLDKDLVVTYKLTDTHGLTPADGAERHILITGDDGGITHLVTSMDEGMTRVPIAADGSFTIGPKEGNVKMIATRVDRLKRSERVVDVPSAQRERLIGEAGAAQVISVRVKYGESSQIVHVPFVTWVLEPAGMGGWNAARAFEIPGVPAKIQLAMSNTWKPAPAHVTLEKFELVTYPGGNPASTNLFRDFVSTLRIDDPITGKPVLTGQAKMNSPIYFADGNWLFFQSGYDKENMATIIGIGNRTGARVMTGGCVLMTIGLMWAFYLKPIIIRKRKEKALREAAAKVQKKQQEPVGAS
jgi:hypothetical protein